MKKHPFDTLGPSALPVPARPVIYVGDTSPDPLYSERAGSRCRVVAVRMDPVSYPLVIRFDDGRMGIAQRASVRPE